MHRVDPISALTTATEPGSTKAAVVHPAFADTSTWDEIIRILEEEALRKFAIAER